ncbi:MAG: hypothetical protein CSA74_09215 [Rhodobacterales bacterium]|nr:MAG: hypothetical protein CSA74_09215 [Rhodobacterales bacterium]
MAISETVSTQFGEERECYIRLNSVEVSNHDVPARALFRGFLSRDAFQGGAAFVWEREVAFSADVAEPLWPQAYAALAGEEGFSGAEV